MFSDGEKTPFHVQMGVNILYLMFRWGKKATFNVPMWNNNSIYCSDGG
jgi:hypothetical protein